MRLDWRMYLEIYHTKCVHPCKYHYQRENGRFVCRAICTFRMNGDTKLLYSVEMRNLRYQFTLCVYMSVCLLACVFVCVNICICVLFVLRPLKFLCIRDRAWALQIKFPQTCFSWKLIKSFIQFRKIHHIFRISIIRNSCKYHAERDTWSLSDGIECVKKILLQPIRGNSGKFS